MTLMNPAIQETELVECKRCENDFNLAAANYYRKICPSCLTEEEKEEIKENTAEVEPAPGPAPWERP